MNQETLISIGYGTSLFALVLCGISIYKEIFKYSTFVLFAMFIVTLALSTYLNSNYVDIRHIGNQEELGQFGDFVGGILNPIFGFLTVLLLLNSIKEQRRANSLFKEAEKVSSNKNQVVQAIDFYKEKLEHLLKERYLVYPTEQTKYSYEFIVGEDSNILMQFGTAVFKLRNYIHLIMDIHQTHGEFSQKYFEEIDSDEVFDVTEHHSIAINHCQAIRVAARKTLSGYHELFALQGVKFLLLADQDKYNKTLDDLLKLKIISDGERNIYIDVGNNLVAKGVERINSAQG